MAILDNAHAALARGFALLAAEATYRPKAGQPRPILVRVENRQTEVEGGVRAEFADLRILTEDLPEHGVGDAVEIGAEAWTLRASLQVQIQSRVSGPFRIIRAQRGATPTMRS